MPMGIVASNSRRLGGLLDHDGELKVEHFLELCDAPLLPVVFFVDVHGNMTHNLCGSSSRIAWPGGERASIPIEGGVDAAFRREIAKTEDPVGRPAVMGARFHVVTSRFHAAEAFRVEDISGLLNARQQVVRLSQKSDTKKGRGHTAPPLLSERCV